MLLDEIPMEAGQTSVGCRSFFLDAGSTPLFPFGYGLSYTTFSYDNLKIVSNKLTVSDTLKVSVELKIPDVMKVQRLYSYMCKIKLAL